MIKERVDLTLPAAPPYLPRFGPIRITRKINQVQLDRVARLSVYLAQTARLGATLLAAAGYRRALGAEADRTRRLSLSGSEAGAGEERATGGGNRLHTDEALLSDGGIVIS